MNTQHSLNIGKLSAISVSRISYQPVATLLEEYTAIESNNLTADC
ncbi:MULTISPECIES: hypothetical protein [unclassified Moorena]|nr:MULTISPECIES: hypothetical protein [unclassified Moorena]